MGPEVDGLVKRKGTTVTKITAESFDRLKEQFLTDIEMISKFESIPKDLEPDCGKVCPSIKLDTRV